MVKPSPNRVADDSDAKELLKAEKDNLSNQTEEFAQTLPAHWYVNESFHQLDKAILIKGSWQVIAHQSQLPNAGDQWPANVADLPLLVVRNQNSEIKVFHNVCRHRAGPLATENQNSKQLRCKYHGWTYTLDGELRSAPEMSTTPNFEPCQYHLPQVEHIIWQGFILVNLNPNVHRGDGSWDTVAEGIESIIAPQQLNTFQYSHRQVYDIECNWKTYMDNYLEGYHLPHVHPGLSRLLDYRSYQTKLAEWYSYQFSPLEDSDVGTISKETNSEIESSADNKSTNFYGQGRAHYFCIYPNIMLNILPNRMQVNIVEAISAQKCRVIFDYYYARLSAGKLQQLKSQDLEFSDQIQQEDIDICERVQKGLASGSYDKGRLCIKREAGVLHYQNLLRQTFSRVLESWQE